MSLRARLDRIRVNTLRRRPWPRTGLLASGLATTALLAGGCVLVPHQPAETAVSATAAAPQNAAGPIAATGSQAVGEDCTFQKTVTDRQRFQVHLDFGKVFEAQGNFERAVDEYHDALKVVEEKHRRTFKPADEALAHRRMAAALDRLGRFDRAEQHYNQALKHDPKNARIWNDAGYSYYLQRRWAEAEHALKTALQLAPDDSRCRTNLGLVLAAAGRSAEALPLLSRSQGDAIGHANLGYLLAATGQLDVARQHYLTALAMRPDLTLARQALAQLDRQQRQAAEPETARTLVAQTQTSQPPARPVDHRVAPASSARVEARAPRPVAAQPAVTRSPQAAAGNTSPTPSRVVPQARIASPVDARVTQARAPAARSSPPIPSRVLPEAKTAGQVGVRTSRTAATRPAIPPPRTNFGQVDSQVARAAATRVSIPPPKSFHELDQ
jgi:tetratricopeptide (TPR) repeat protein